jgi:hypothetical protein
LFDRQCPGHQFATALSGRSDEPIVKALIPDRSGIFLFRRFSELLFQEAPKKIRFQGEYKN